MSLSKTVFKKSKNCAVDQVTSHQNMAVPFNQTKSKEEKQNGKTASEIIKKASFDRIAKEDKQANKINEALIMLRNAQQGKNRPISSFKINKNFVKNKDFEHGQIKANDHANKQRNCSPVSSGNSKNQKRAKSPNLNEFRLRSKH